MAKNDLPEPDQLLVRIAKDEGLTEEEELVLVSLLTEWGNEGLPRERSQDDLYAYLVVLNKSGLKKHYKLLDRFLDAKDALTVSFVLETLCVDWQMSGEYLQRAISFAIGAPWDSEGDAREQALKVLGEYLRADLSPETLKNVKKLSKPQKEVSLLLLQTVNDEDNNNWVRQASYFALCRAYGIEWEQLPPECTLICFDKNDPSIDKTLLSKVESLVSCLN